MKPKTVMVVDDDPIMIAQAKRRLEKLGYAVITRDQALGSAQAISTSAPDIVMLDVHMPTLSGDKLAGILHDHARRLPKLRVLLHSSLALTRFQAMAKQVGAFGAIAKTPNDALFSAQFERLARA